MGEKARTHEWVTYMEDFSSTVGHLKATCSFWSQPKARETLEKRARKFDLVLHSPVQFQERVLFAPFWSSNFFESTLLRLSYALEKFEMSRHCREDDDDGGGPATKVPRESIDDHSTRWQTRSWPPCLRWTSRNVFCVTLINKTRSCWSQEALTRCTLDSTATILLSAVRIRTDDVCSLRSTSRQTFMRRKWCTMPHATESTPAPNPWTPLPLPTSRMPKVLLIIQRLIPMTATRHDMAFKRLASMIEEWITDDAYCTMGLLNHIVPYGWMHHLEFGAGQIQGGAFSQMPKSPGCPWSAIDPHKTCQSCVKKNCAWYMWQVIVRWSTGKKCQRLQFEELESHDQKALWGEIGLSQT